MNTTIITILYFVSMYFSNSPMQHRPNIEAYTTRPNACRTYNIGGYDATDGIACSMGESVKHEKEESNIVSIEVVPSTIVVIPDVVKEVPVVTEDSTDVPSYDTESDSKPDKEKKDKVHCNKGEGNGSEGCDPGNNPDKGNDDENDTTPKEDKKDKEKK